MFYRWSLVFLHFICILLPVCTELHSRPVVSLSAWVAGCMSWPFFFCQTLWRITNVILCLIWIHVLTKRCRARQRCLRLFPDHLGLGQLCLLSMRSMTTERLNLYSANDFVLARCGFVRFIALSFDVLSQPKKSPSSNPDYKDTL